jgi:hypothetical protein
MRVRLPVAVLALVLAFAGGIVSSRVRDAHAQAAPFAATIYVPSDGLAFRTFNGRVVARLSYDPHGGVFELYDDHERPAVRVRGEPLPQGAPAVVTPPPKRPDDFGF